jgi:hypothetical protein
MRLLTNWLIAASRKGNCGAWGREGGRHPINDLHAEATDATSMTACFVVIHNEQNMHLVRGQNLEAIGRYL